MDHQKFIAVIISGLDLPFLSIGCVLNKFPCDNREGYSRPELKNFHTMQTGCNGIIVISAIKAIMELIKIQNEKHVIN